MQNRELDIYNREIARVRTQLKLLLQKKKELEEAYGIKAQKRPSKPRLKKKKEREKAIEQFLFTTFPGTNITSVMEELERVQRECDEEGDPRQRNH